jgi:hypothetical protein
MYWSCSLFNVLISNLIRVRVRRQRERREERRVGKGGRRRGGC